MFAKFIKEDNRWAFAFDQQDEDWIEYPDDKHAALFAAVNSSPTLKVIGVGSDGLPEVQDPSYTETELAQMARAKRDILLAKTDHLVMPDYPIEQDKLAEVKVARQQLRDIPEQKDFPTVIAWPEDFE